MKGTEPQEIGSREHVRAAGALHGRPDEPHEQHGSR
jgi:hypothetical protein